MQLCLFSVGYAGLWGQERLELGDFLRRAAQLGYGAVMLMGKRPHLAPVDMSAEKVADLRAVLVETRLECAVLGAYTDFSGAGAAEVPFLEMQISYVETLSRLAKDLGAKDEDLKPKEDGPGKKAEAACNVATTISPFSDTTYGWLYAGDPGAS